MKSEEYNGGWAVLIKLALVLVAPTILGEIWLARNAWVLDERVTHLIKNTDTLEGQVQRLHDRVIELELVRKP